MNGVELTRQQGGMGLPFGFAGNVEFMVDEGIAGGGGGGGGVGVGGGGGGGGLAKSPWPVLPTTPSPNALHKMLAELSYGPHLKTDIASTSGHFGPLQPPSFSRFSDHLVNPISYSATNWVRQLQGTLPTECYNGFGSSGPKDSVRHYSQHITLNGGSLVLDTARGELVNASKMTPKEILEAKALAASKSHSEAERRRRERINTHLATLRTLLPSSTKTDKASLLAEVIDQVKTLKRQVSEIYEYGPMPTDHDELSVEKVSSSAEGRILIRASLCCDDRPDLMTDLRDALDTLRLRTLKAEISTLGGRIKNVFIVTLKEDTEDLDQDISKRVKEALKLVMDGPGSGELSPGSSNKRQRVSSFELPGCT